LVELSLYETTAWWLSYHIAGLLGSGEVPGRNGTAAPFLAPYELFETADRQLMVCAGNDGMFHALCRALEVPELVDEPAYRSNSDRVANRQRLHVLLEERLRQRSAAEWHATLLEHSVPCSPVSTIDEFVNDSQLAALGLLQPVEHQHIPDLRLVGSPLHLDGERPTTNLPPPTLGEHTASVLADLGYSEEQVRDLLARGVVAGE
jgi:crotonobetainyl-CoA:carnitine CoA-transferase CaiB-like acyl-CoA transferase